MQVLIISGGSIDTTYALAFLSKREYNYVIAVDKGCVVLLGDTASGRIF